MHCTRYTLQLIQNWKYTLIQDLASWMFNRMQNTFYEIQRKVQWMRVQIYQVTRVILTCYNVTMNESSSALRSTRTVGSEICDYKQRGYRTNESKAMTMTCCSGEYHALHKIQLINTAENDYKTHGIPTCGNSQTICYAETLDNHHKIRKSNKLQGKSSG